jgi:hypothetical protein
MIPAAQRIAIAVACGWTDTQIIDGKYGQSEVPDYLADLNAMHEAEKVLTQDQMIDYSRNVGKLVTSHLPASRAAWMDYKLINSTASQRAEAFIRTIGKWEEAK